MTAKEWVVERREYLALLLKPYMGREEDIVGLRIMATTDLPLALDALEAVLEVHQPVDVEPSDTICGDCSFLLPNGRYFGKLVEWPCPTVAAITTALEENR